MRVGMGVGMKIVGQNKVRLSTVLNNYRAKTWMEIEDIMLRKKVSHRKIITI